MKFPLLLTATIAIAGLGACDRPPVDVPPIPTTIITTPSPTAHEKSAPLIDADAATGFQAKPRSNAGIDADAPK